MQNIKLFIELTRLNKPIGFMLLFWPCAWGLTLAYDFSFLSPCPTSGLMIYGKKDELVPIDHIKDLNKRLSAQKGIKVEFDIVSEANHFFSKADEALIKCLNKYIKKETALY